MDYRFRVRKAATGDRRRGGAGPRDGLVPGEHFGGNDGYEEREVRIVGTGTAEEGEEGFDGAFVGGEGLVDGWEGRVGRGGG